MTQFVKIYYDSESFEKFSEVSSAIVIDQLQGCNVLSEVEKRAFKIAVIDIRDRASFFVKENQVRIKMNWTMG